MQTNSFHSRRISNDTVIYVLESLKNANCVDYKSGIRKISSSTNCIKTFLNMKDILTRWLNTMEGVIISEKLVITISSHLDLKLIK